MQKIWNTKKFVEDDKWQDRALSEVDGLQDYDLVRLNVLLNYDDIDARVGLKKIGVIISPSDDVFQIKKIMKFISFAQIDFPVFGDGRGYSQCALLIERLGFAGEIRAAGNVLFDQIFLMERAGFSSFAITDIDTIECLENTAANENHLFYQPSMRKCERATSGFSWRRVVES